jgi:hypothetical protein
VFTGDRELFVEGELQTAELPISRITPIKAEHSRNNHQELYQPLSA